MGTAMQVYGGIWMGCNEYAQIGDLRISLLEKIGECGSITQAAKSVGISYKTAWDALDVMKNISSDALVESASGGRGGGGSRLTDAGKKLVRTYRLIKSEHERFLCSISEGMDDFDNFYRLVRRLSMKSSARNQFFGNVISIKEGPINSEIEIVLKGDEHIVAVITNESRESLGLKAGSEVWALVKASWVVLGTGENNIRLSARNRLCGTISRLTRGEVNSDVVLTLPGGNTVSAIVTRESVEEMKLEVGIKSVPYSRLPALFLALQLKPI